LPTRPLAHAKLFSFGLLTDVISISVSKGDSDSLVKQIFEILAEVGEDKVARVLELVVDVAVGSRVVKIDSNGILYVCLVEVRGQVRRRRRVIAGVTDIVGTTAGEALKLSVRIDMATITDWKTYE
jgi:hypothetical protein